MNSKIIWPFAVIVIVFMLCLTANSLSKRGPLTIDLNVRLSVNFQHVIDLTPNLKEKR